MPDSLTQCSKCGKDVIEGIPFCPHCGAKQPEPLTDDEYQRNPYHFLQVAENADIEVINAAYRQLARKYHPDTTNPTASEEKMRDINWAHDLLTNPIKLEQWKKHQPRPQTPNIVRSGPSTSNPNDYYNNSAPPSDPPTSPQYRNTSVSSSTKSKSTSLGRTIVIIFSIIIISFTCRMYSANPTSEPVPTPKILPSFTPKKTVMTRPKNTSTPYPINTEVPELTYYGLKCIGWTDITDLHIDKHICIYGKIFSFGPYSDKWNTIYFSDSSKAFRVVDFNGYYINAPNLGDCVRVYGKIRDNGEYLLITPDKDAEDALVAYPAKYCK